jgi:acetyl-CoA carboxylase biotin carboxyl carrier protein
MDPQRIKAFIDAMAASDLDEMEISHEGWTLRLVRRHGGRPELAASPAANSAPARAAQPARAPAAKAAARPEVLSPMFGVVHLQQSPGEPPFVREGQAIAQGDLLCIIEAMKVFNEVRAERAGTVAAILVKSGQEVEAEQVLLRLE